MKEEKANRWCAAVAVAAGERRLLLLLLLLLRDGGEELLCCRKSETRTSHLSGIRCRGRRGSVSRRVRKSGR